MSARTRSAYTHVVVHPVNEDGSREVWSSYTETAPNIGSFETDGIIGWIYHLDGGYVWMNEAGHPTRIFWGLAALTEWVQALAPSNEWLG